MTYKKLLSRIKTIAPVSLIVTLLLLLSGCSPHPGAGHWKADGDNTMNISWINVIFEGTADIFANQQQESILRCFWAATEKNSIQMQCVHSDDTEKKETYQLVILDSGQGKLKQNEQLIGLFTKEIPPVEEPEAESKPQN
jgi:hypothetical protein